MTRPNRRDQVKSRPEHAAEEVAALGQADSVMQTVYGKRVDAIDKKLGLHSALNKQPTLSTGLLSVDLVLGKGITPGFSVFLGAEASAKSTACMTTLWSSLQRPIPVRKYFDAEGAVDRRYTGNILQTDSWGDVFGDQGRGGWINALAIVVILADVAQDIRKLQRDPEINGILFALGAFVTEDLDAGF